jgi:molybdopterin converting factor subunit 1|tara:strand:+ start:95 stop:334 length:240 start_codon:yes stop_codon:yes gene_type:complete
MNVTVLYFGSLREQRGLAEERIHTTATNVSELFTELSENHRFSFQLDQLRAALNEDFCTPETRLSENDTIALMPPMAGG